MGWYHISYRSYNAVRPPLSPRFSPALPLYLSSRSHSTVFPHPSATLVSLPCPSSPSHSFPFSLSLSRIVFSSTRALSPRVTSRFFSRRFLHLCVSAASSRASCLHFALTFSPPRLLLPRCSALTPFPSPPRYIATLHCTLERFLFLFLQPRADPLLALSIYQARRIRVALPPRARGC